MHWQFAEQLGFLCAGAEVFEFTDKNRRVLEYVESLFRHHSPGVLELTEFLVDTAAETGYWTPEGVGHFVEAAVKRMFDYAGLRFKSQYLERVSNPIPDEAPPRLTGPHELTERKQKEKNHEPAHHPSR